MTRALDADAIEFIRKYHPCNMCTLLDSHEALRAERDAALAERGLSERYYDILEEEAWRLRDALTSMLCNIEPHRHWMERHGHPPLPDFVVHAIDYARETLARSKPCPKPCPSE